LAPHIEAYIRFKRGLGRKYLTVNYVDALGKFAQGQGLREIGQIDYAMLLAFLSSRNWQESTRKEAQGVFVGFFRFLARSGIITTETNPAKRLPRIRRPPRPAYIFSVREIALVLEQLEKAQRQPFNQQLYYVVVLLIYGCGLRRAEACRLRVADLDLENSVLFIRCTKFGKDRRIPIGPRVCDKLAQYYQSRVERLGHPLPDAHFFVQATSAPLKPGCLQWQFRTACARARIGSASGPKPRIHDLRHSFAVHRLNKWYAEGVDVQSRLTLLSIYMGHVHEESTRHYLHLSQDLLRIAARPMERNLHCWLPDLIGELDES
jgi:integrase